MLAISLATICAPSTVIAETQKFEFKDVQAILKTYGIKMPVAELKDFTTDADGQTLAFLFIDSKDIAHIYMNEKKLYEGEWQHCSGTPRTFEMTADGHLFFVPNCFSLYVDGMLIATDEGMSAGMDSNYTYHNGSVIFISGDSIKQFHLSKRKSTLLYRHPNRKIIWLQIRGKHLAYLVREGARLYHTEKSSFPDTPFVKWGEIKFYTPLFGVYVDGKRIGTKIGLFPAHQLSSDGTVYFVSQRGQGYVLSAGRKFYAEVKKASGIHVDNNDDIWFFFPEENPTDGITRVLLFRNKKSINLPAPLIGFEILESEKGHFALLGKISNGNPSHRLIYDGKFLGETFSLQFPAPHGNDTLFFGKNGKIYMRVTSAINQMGVATENGVPILSKVFKNVLRILKRPDDTIVVYGIK